MPPKNGGEKINGTERQKYNLIIYDRLGLGS